MRQVRSGHGQMSVDAVIDPEDWVDRHGDGLYRYALLRLRSPDLAADVVQETFLEALRAGAPSRGVRASGHGWLESCGTRSWTTSAECAGSRQPVTADRPTARANRPSIAGAAGGSARPTGEANRAGRWRPASFGMSSTGASPSSHRDSPTPSFSVSWTAWARKKSSRPWASPPRISGSDSTARVCACDDASSPAGSAHKRRRPP